MKIERKRLVLLSLLVFWQHHRFCTENQPERDAEDIRRGKDTL